jgi:hypothetical protein
VTSTSSDGCRRRATLAIDLRATISGAALPEIALARASALAPRAPFA